MATKSQKAKAPNKLGKKAEEKLEISLRKKIKDFVFSLGHDAEEIGDEIKKTSKVLAKRLNVKLKEAKKSIDEKVSKVKKSTKTETKKSQDKVAKEKSNVKKEMKKLAKKAAPVKKEIAAAKKTATKSTTKKAATTAPKKNDKKTTAPKKEVEKTASKKAVKKPVDTKEKSTKETHFENPENAHPETPVVAKKRSGAPIPKSDTKPHNTDLPLEAGPRNKYKRG